MLHGRQILVLGQKVVGWAIACAQQRPLQHKKTPLPTATPPEHVNPLARPGAAVPCALPACHHTSAGNRHVRTSWTVPALVLHLFLPLPLCVVAGSNPDFCPSFVTLWLQPRPGPLRSRPCLSTLSPALVATSLSSPPLPCLPCRRYSSAKSRCSCGRRVNGSSRQGWLSGGHSSSGRSCWRSHQTL
jgi:hypothetical protein